MTFRAKRDAQDWARRVEDEMVRGVYIQRRPAERTTLKAALERYLDEVTLRRDQVDLARRVVRLSDTKKGSARSVPLSREAARLLNEALNHPARTTDTDLIFWGEPGRDGRRRPDTFQLVWRQALQRAGITGLHFHDLRHEAVSCLVEAGLSDQEVAAISGDKSMQMLKR